MRRARARAAPSETEKVRTSCSPGEERDRLEGARVADAGKDELGPEQRQEAVRLPIPPRPGLCKVLQAGQRHDTLAATLGDERREVVEGRDVCQLVKDEKQWRLSKTSGASVQASPALGSATVADQRALIDGGPHLANQPRDERGGVSLMIAAGADIQRSPAV